MQVRLTDQASDDLFSIWAHIASDSLRNADECVDRIMKRAVRLADFPRLGPARSNVAAGARFLVVQRWLVIYRVTSREIRIVRIVDASRDLNSLDIPQA